MFKSKLFFISCFFLAITLFLNANVNPKIRSEVILLNTTSFYHQPHLATSLLIMEDDSMWEIINPPLIKKDPDAPDPLFYFKLSEWEAPMFVGIDTYQWLMEIDIPSESNRSEYEFIKGKKFGDFPYIIENRKTFKFAFARPLNTEEAIRFFKEYANGYIEGKSAQDSI